ncbi:MAG: agmatine deiminase family protein [Myxococcales bacterium]|nr:agmatine deiminase family protein [Myxococcales bacterium]USN50355.1 MAG: agmatine deiminase family protein [Myxococcales bacterium]
MYIRPAEWSSPKEIWLGWPYDKSLWQHNLSLAQSEVLSLIKALSKEKVRLVVPNEEEIHKISAHVSSQVQFEVLDYADIWLRDTFPICVKDEHKKYSLVVPRFNGWGEKYLFESDRDLSKRVVDRKQLDAHFSSVVFEGGAIECDGEGTMLTTEQCLLNPNRNPSLTKTHIENEFARLFGVKKVIWLKQGLKNDHTDGHIDTIARFVAPATVAIMVPQKGDPNAHVMETIKKQLESEVDALGRPLKLLEIPSPGAIIDESGELMPASYLNFIMGDSSFVVPTYASEHDAEAIECFNNFIDCEVVGVSARAILSGGGAFHCMSQEFYLEAV